LKVDVLAVNALSTRTPFDSNNEPHNLNDFDGGDGQGTDLSVIVRMVTLHECFDYDDDACSPSNLSNIYISSYKEKLSVGASSGRLAQKIIEFAEILDVTELFGVLVDSDSVGILISSKTIELDTPKHSSGARRSFRPNVCTLCVFAVLTISLATFPK
jgi:hypothetical protein